MSLRAQVSLVCLLALAMLTGCNTPYPKKISDDTPKVDSPISGKPQAQQIFVAAMGSDQQLKPATGAEIASGKVSEYFVGTGKVGNFGGSLTVATFGSGPKDLQSMGINRS